MKTWPVDTLNPTFDSAQYKDDEPITVQPKGSLGGLPVRDAPRAEGHCCCISFLCWRKNPYTDLNADANNIEMAAQARRERAEAFRRPAYIAPTTFPERDPNAPPRDPIKAMEFNASIMARLQVLEPKMERIHDEYAQLAKLVESNN